MHVYGRALKPADKKYQVEVVSEERKKQERDTDTGIISMGPVLLSDLEKSTVPRVFPHKVLSSYWTTCQTDL